MRLPLSVAFAAFALVSAAPADAQRRQATPEERIDRLEKQVRQVQKQVFPKGQPADTAGFSDEPAATLMQTNQLSNRLDAIEQQMADLVRSSEENGNRLSTMEAELARLRADQDRRLRTLESGGGGGGTGDDNGPTTVDSATFDQSGTVTSSGDLVQDTPLVSKPKVEKSKPKPAPVVTSAKPGDANFEAAGEEAYDRGYNLWNSGRYDEAITALRAMASSFPGHRRVSWANNLVGRSLLDKGQPRAAAEALLANYRSNPKGERAPDSLFYLGQALVKLGQREQACKAYGELQDVYGSTMRAELQRQLPSARAVAKCS
jgi:TolA-binding protein